MRTFLLTLILGVCSLQFSLAAKAQTRPTPPAIDQFLSKFWTKGPDNRRAAESVWKELDATDRTGPVVWAYVLNRIAQDLYRPANAEMGELIQSASQPDWDAGAWDRRYTAIWLKLVVGEVDSALLDMQQVKSDLAVAEAANRTVDEPTRFRLFTRLGRLYGFVEGPRNENATPATLHETLAILTDGLGDVDYGHFQDQRQQVLRRFQDMSDEKTTQVNDQLAQRKQEAEIRTQQILVENATIDDRQSQLRREINDLQAEMNQKVNDLRSDSRPIESDLRSIDRDIRRSDREIALLISDISRLSFQAANEPDPFIRNDLYLRVDLLDRRLFTEQGVRNGLQGEYNRALTQLEIINAEIASVQQQMGGQIQLRQAEAKTLLGTQKRNLRELKKLQNPKANRGYIKSTEAKISHLPTYDPFPTDQFRKELLGQFK